MDAGDHSTPSPAPPPANSQTLHGVLLEVMGIGVLITGPSGIGKSELALELITRGQRLIADDAPEFIRATYGSEGDTVLGRCPPLLQNFLEVRGLGLLDIRAMFGDHAIRREAALKLIIELHPQGDDGEPPERLGLTQRARPVLDINVPCVHLPVAAGRDLAVLVEAAARRQILYYNGYDAAQTFIERQRRQLQDPSE